MSNKHQTTSSHSVFHFVQSPMKRALICDCLWQNIVWLCPSTTAHVAVCHFVLSNQRLWKTAEILPFTWMQKSFQRIPSGNIHNNITTWASLKSQMLTVPAFGDRDSKDFLTNARLTSSLSVHKTSVTHGITKSMVISLVKYSRY